MVVLALQPKGYAASLFYTPFDRTSNRRISCTKFEIALRHPLQNTGPVGNESNHRVSKLALPQFPGRLI